MKVLERPPREKVAEFFQGHLVGRLDISRVEEIYPVSNDRFVFRYERDRVIKIRPENTPYEREAALGEAGKIEMLLGFYNQQGCPFSEFPVIQEREEVMVIEMPYMGENILRMNLDLDLSRIGQDIGDDGFKGFTQTKIEMLIAQLRGDLELLERQYHHIHGDLFQRGDVAGQGRGPNNIVYNRQLDRFLVIDAEALVNLDRKPSKRTVNQAREQLEQAVRWIRENMVVEEVA